MSFQQQLLEKQQYIETVLTAYLPEQTGLQQTVIEAMHYSVLAGGKRLRPMLMLETYRLFGGNGKVVEPFMAAQELIHTYSLVHDDLPAMDNDEYRRGKKTTHAVYGEAMAILAGDALLNRAFEVAAGALDMDCSPKTARALQILGKKAGILGMIGGQVADIQWENRAADMSVLQFIHKNKTAALIESAMTIGAVLAGASEEAVAVVESIASDIGFAFQIRDDILDVTGSMQALGKPVGSDEKNSKTTYVSLQGLEQAKEDVQKLSQRALQNLDRLGGDHTFLRELIQMLICRES